MLNIDSLSTIANAYKKFFGAVIYIESHVINLSYTFTCTFRRIGEFKKRIDMQLAG